MGKNPVADEPDKAAEQDSCGHCDGGKSGCKAPIAGRSVGASGGVFWRGLELVVGQNRIFPAYSKSSGESKLSNYNGRHVGWAAVFDLGHYFWDARVSGSSVASRRCFLVADEDGASRQETGSLAIKKV